MRYTFRVFRFLRKYQRQLILEQARHDLHTVSEARPGIALKIIAIGKR